MLDTTQVLLIVVISVLTVLLTIIGIAIYQILKEFLKSVKKMNLILDDSHKITSSIAQPMEDASELLHGLKRGVNFIKNIGKLLGAEEKIVKEFKEKTHPKEESSGSKKRFFLKSGKSLN